MTTIPVQSSFRTVTVASQLVFSALSFDWTLLE